MNEIYKMMNFYKIKNILNCNAQIKGDIKLFKFHFKL